MANGLAYSGAAHEQLSITLCDVEWKDGWLDGSLSICFSSHVFDVMGIVCRFLLDGIDG
jgi:hypothetical protein